MPSSPADWQLPPGVSRGLWDYLHDASLARSYDESLADSPLLRLDLWFAERYFDRPGRLIDLGCGSGRLLLPFARRGYWVVGVDLSEGMLNVTAAKAIAAGVEVQLLQANLVVLECLAEQSFDYAACLFSTLGMVTGAAQRRRVIDHVYCLLRPGGKFVLHVHNRGFNFWDRAGRHWLLQDLFRILARSDAQGDRIMPPHRGITGLALHHFTRREAVRLLRQAGFRILEVYPVSLRSDGRLRIPAWFGWLRAYGYMIAAQKP